MTLSMKLLTLVTVALQSLPKSDAVHPFHQAFSPLREAFGDSIFNMKPSADVETLFITPKGSAISSVPDDKVIIENEEANIRETNGQLTSGPTNSQRIPTTQEVKKPNFNLDTFTFNRNNTRRKNDIFSALADVVKNEPQELREKDENSLRENVISNSRITPLDRPNNQGSSGSNDFSKTILHVVKNIEKVLSTMSVMRDLYHTKSNVTTSTEPEVSLPEASSILDVLLDVPTLEGIRTASLTARSEKEFLDHMTSVLIGAETRSSALTLDPVTVIALLTLAAYLLRAVYQIIAVTGRSFDVSDGDLNLSLSDLPEALTRIHNWVSLTNIDFERDERVTREVRENLDAPGDLAAVLKLHRQGNPACVRQFLCQQLQYRPLFKTLKLSDMFVGSLSYYYGEPSMSRYIDQRLDDHDSNCSSNDFCSSDTLNDASSLKIIFGSAAKKVLSLAATYQNWL